MDLRRWLVPGWAMNRQLCQSRRCIQGCYELLNSVSCCRKVKTKLSSEVERSILLHGAAVRGC